MRDGDHFNFLPQENRGNIVDALTMTHKTKSGLDGKPINIYQKPRKLLNWFVQHFSVRGDWVLDLFSGSGTTLLSSLALGRHCASVEIDDRQVQSLVPRIRVLDKDMMGNAEYLASFKQYRKDFLDAELTKDELVLTDKPPQEPAPSEPRCPVVEPPVAIVGEEPPVELGVEGPTADVVMETVVTASPTDVVTVEDVTDAVDEVVPTAPSGMEGGDASTLDLSQLVEAIGHDAPIVEASQVSGGDSPV